MRTLFAGIATLLALLSPAAGLAGETVTMDGSETTRSLAQKWADAFKAKHPDASIQVAGNGASTAFAALAAKRLDLVLIPRAIRFKEVEPCETALGKRPPEFKVAVSGVALYIHTNNPVQVLNYDELFNVFRGDAKSWKGVGGNDAPISVYVMGTNTVWGELFNEEVLNGKGLLPSAAKSDPEKGPMAAIAKDPGGIGFGPFTTPPDGARFLSIKRSVSSTPVDPSPDGISNKIYPISRVVYCYAGATADSPSVKAFLDFIRSDEGQQVAAAAGFFPLPAKWRPAP